MSQSVAEIRREFIKGLFAVAISVGFATTVLNMDAVKNVSLPQGGEIEQVMILFVGLFITVFSWEGYLFSINKKELKDTTRFIIDIVLVFVYMFFLITSSKPEIWLFTVLIIFFLYVIWDCKSIHEFTLLYDDRLERQSGFGMIANIYKVYKNGFYDDPITNRGPIISFSWLIYFLILWLFKQIESGGGVSETAFYAFLAILGLVAYRHDKKNYATLPSGEAANVAGYSMPGRAALILLVLPILIIYQILS